MKILLIALLLQGCAAFDTPYLPIPFAVMDINNSVNRVPSADDGLVWGKVDYWATPKEFYAKGAGDCEEYAIAKYFELRQAGIPASKLRITNILIDDGDTEHMILMYEDKGKDYVLDNIVERVTPVKEYIDFKIKYTFNENGMYFDGQTVPPNYLPKWGSVIRRMKAGGQIMNVRDMINNLTYEYKKSLVGVVDGKATVEQQEEVLAILKSIEFYTIRLLVFGNDEIEGT